jgi:enoyl-CoA hydratase/carnithine racemase
MIRTEDRDELRVVTLDRPERRNALTLESLADLERAVTGADQPVVYLAGAGGAFSAGADFDAVSEAAEGGPAAIEAFVERGQRTMRAVEGAESAVVAGVDGPARGGGVELALACDLRVATPDATFAETGVSLGLFGAWGGTARLPEVVGTGDALDLSLSGRTVDAGTALRMGLVQRVVEEPLAVAEEIAANDADAVRTLKRLLRGDGDGAGGGERERQEARERDAFVELLSARADDLGSR